MNSADDFDNVSKEKEQIGWHEDYKIDHDYHEQKHEKQNST